MRERGGCVRIAGAGYSGDRVMIGPGFLQDGSRFAYRHAPSFSFFCIDGPRGDKGRDSKRVQRDAEHSLCFPP